MEIDFKKMCINLLGELVSFRELQTQHKKLEAYVKSLSDRRDSYNQEYDRLSQIEREEKFWCRERIRNKFMISTVIVVTIITSLGFLGGLGICNLLKITS